MGFDNKLWRVVAISRLFENDPQGASVKARYQELLASLTEKYGKPRSVHSLGDSIFAQPAYFIAGLRSGKSFWYSELIGADVKVQVAIRAESNDGARWFIYYENKALSLSFQESKRLKEKGALYCAQTALHGQVRAIEQNAHPSKQAPQSGTRA